MFEILDDDNDEIDDGRRSGSTTISSPCEPGERGGLVVNASDSGSRGRGSSPTRFKPCCVLEQGAFTPQKYW